MQRIHRWRDNISWFMAAVTVAVAYELRLNGVDILPKSNIEQIDQIAPALGATVLLLASLGVARALATWAISFEWVRALIMKENHVEGFWHLQTDNEDNVSFDQGASPLSRDGILWLRYDTDQSQYCVTTTRLDEQGKPYEIPSKLVHMRLDGQLLLYVNYFVISTGGPRAREGVSKGYFVKSDDTSKRKNKFDAYIFAEGEETRHQSARKISRREIREFRRRAKGADSPWIEAYIARASSTEK